MKRTLTALPALGPALGAALCAAFSALPALAQAGAEEEPSEQIAPSEIPFAEGQVWHFETRPGDERALLKIQLIEDVGTAQEPMTLYHLSLIGVNVPGMAQPMTVMHLPISEMALRTSITQPYEGQAAFPNAEEGIAVWRQDQGGVFTITLAEITDVLRANYQAMLDESES